MSKTLKTIEKRRRVLRAKTLRRQNRLQDGVRNYQAHDMRHPAHPRHEEHMKFIKLLYLLRVSLPRGESIFSMMFPRQKVASPKVEAKRAPVTHKTVTPEMTRVFTPFRMDGLGDKNAG